MFGIRAKILTRHIIRSCYIIFQDPTFFLPKSFGLVLSQIPFQLFFYYSLTQHINQEFLQHISSHLQVLILFIYSYRLKGNVTEISDRIFTSFIKISTSSQISSPVLRFKTLPTVELANYLFNSRLWPMIPVGYNRCYSPTAAAKQSRNYESEILAARIQSLTY